MALSIVINTAPEREDNLTFCLQQLRNQTFKDFEVLVCDDGSRKAETVVRGFEDSLDIKYFWRANDLCVNRSRNTGIQHSANEKLVLLDGDCLINSEALAVYDHLLEKYPNILWSGYVGYIRQFVSNSACAPDRLVNYLDRRFLTYSATEFKPAPLILEQPAQACWGGNLAFQKQVWSQLNGFDEAFVGWGNNDTEFAFRALEKGYQVHFCLDSWAEHQCHSYGENYHHAFQKKESSGKKFVEKRQHPPLTYQVTLYASPKKMMEVYQLLVNYYTQQDQSISGQMKQIFLTPGARLMLKELGRDQWKIGGAIPSE